MDSRPSRSKYGSGPKCVRKAERTFATVALTVTPPSMSFVLLSKKKFGAARRKHEHDGRSLLWIKAIKEFILYSHAVTEYSPFIKATKLLFNCGWGEACLVVNVRLS